MSNSFKQLLRYLVIAWGTIMGMSLSFHNLVPSWVSLSIFIVIGFLAGHWAGKVED